MKMKELETKTGIGREAIRFYIREGLLPEPEKPKRNVAVYSKEHVERIHMIRKLKDERFLPLSEIRSILDVLDEEDGPARDLLGLEFQLAARLGSNALTPKPVAALLQEIDLDLADLQCMQEDGVIEIYEGSQGPTLSGQDARITQMWVELQANGFTKELGYTARDLNRYLTAAENVADQEVENFFDRIPGTQSTEKAAALAETGLALVDQIFSILHSRTVLRKVSERNATDAEAN